MKIISNFQDVYDQCAMYGIDEDTVYRRFIEAEYVKPEGDFAIMASHLKSARYHTRWDERNIDSFFGEDAGRTSIMFLVVGEHVIPHVGGLKVRCEMNAHGSGEVFYSSWQSNSLEVENIRVAEDIISPLGRVFSSYEEMAVHLKLDVLEQGGLGKTRRIGRFKIKSSRQVIDFTSRRYLMDGVMHSSELMAPFKDSRWAEAIGAPLALVIPSEVGRKAPTRKDRPPTLVQGALIVRNPSIKYMGLTSLMDPHSIHQEISMAMNGFLANQQDGTDSISDSDRAKSKGFDDISFKTRKGTKKPRRKKAKVDE